MKKGMQARRGMAGGMASSLEVKKTRAPAANRDRPEVRLRRSPGRVRQMGCRYLATAKFTERWRSAARRPAGSEKEEHVA